MVLTGGHCDVILVHRLTKRQGISFVWMRLAKQDWYLSWVNVLHA